MKNKVIFKVVLIVSTFIFGGHTTYGQSCERPPDINAATSYLNWNDSVSRYSNLTNTSGEMTANSTFTVGCYPGYVLDGNAIVECTVDGDWSAVPNCTIEVCWNEPAVNATTSYSNWIYNESGWNANTTVMVECYPGYNLTGNTTVTCIRNDTWSDVPTCSLISCPVPKHIDSVSRYTNLTNTSGEMTANSTFTVGCYPGYVLNGSAIVECTVDGDWSAVPNCTIEVCWNEPAVNATTSYSNWIYNESGWNANTTVMVECYPGYNLTENTTVTCIRNDTWSDVPTCSLIYCIGPEIKNGIRSPSLPVAANSSVNFTCNTGYKLVGNETTECNISGAFDQVPTCELQLLPLGSNFTLEVLPESNDSVSIVGTLSSNNSDADAFYVEISTYDAINNTGYFNITQNKNANMTFNKLQPGTRYILQVFLSNGGFRSNESQSINVSTLPNCVRSWKLTNTTRNTMTFVQNVTPESFEFYLLEMPNKIEYTVNNLLCNSTSPCVFLKNITVLEVSGLDAGSLYNFSFTTAMKGSDSNYLRSPDTCQSFSLYTVPNHIQEDSIRISNKTNNSMTVTWDEIYGVYTGYNVTFTCKSPNVNSQSPARYNSTVFSNETSVFGLDPGTFCNVSVQPYLDNGDHGFLYGDIVTKLFNESSEEAAPGTVQGNVTVITSRSANLTWSVPNVRNGIIRHYIAWVNDTANACILSAVWTCSDCDLHDASLNISSLEFLQCLKMEPSTFSTSEQTYTWLLTNLHPYRHYTAYLRAYTVELGEYYVVSFSTLEDIPGNPVGLKSIESSDLSIKIQWSPPEEPNGEITNYTVKYTYLNRTCRGPGYLENNTIEVNDTETQLIENVYSFWNYRIVVRATNKIGPGNFSEALEVRTNEAIPDIIDTIAVSSVFSRNATVTWEDPCFINGELRHYHLEMINTPVEGGEVINETFTIQSNEKQMVLDNLLPFRNYSVRVKAENNVANGSYSVSFDFQTQIDVPEKPTGLSVFRKTYSEIEIRWNVATQFTGPTKYIVEVFENRDSNNIYRNETHIAWKNVDLARSALVTDLDEYWEYSIDVTAETSYGDHGPLRSQSARIIIRTAEYIPGSVQNLEVQTETALDKPRQLYVSWEPPTERDLNGNITHYEVFCSKRNERILTDSDNRSLIITLLIDDWEVITVQVRAETNAGWGAYAEKTVTVYPGAPEVPAETSDNPLTRKSDIRVDDSKEMLAVELPKSFLCNNTNGKAVQWGVIVAEESKATDPSFIGSVDEYWKRKDTLYKKWSDIKDEDVIPPYVTTGPTWKPNCGIETHRPRRAVVEEGQTLTYIVGNEDCSNSNGYCNGPLKPGRSYRVKSYACTTTGCTETLYSLPIQTAPDRTGAIVGGFLAALFAIAIVAVVIYARRKQKLCFKRRAFKPNKMAEDMEFDAIGNQTSEYVFGPGLVKLSDFPMHVDKLHRDINLLFNKAYKMLIERSPCFPATVASSEDCMPKNRYVNILPYDRSRVKLKPLDGKEGSDYINANYIPGYTFRREYIATQGPLPVTFDDFWRMIWEEDVETIVMLTQLMEQNRVKCDMYWPASKTPVAYGTLLVSVHSEEKLEQYILRIFEVKHNEERRLVNHFQYLPWPDMGCPEDPQMLLDFVAAVRECTYKPGSKSPIVVHCSAGVGRTGTFIAVDYLLQHIRDHDEIDIFQVVLEMREHRCQMVQTEDQFVYIHDVLKEFIINDDEDDEEVDDEHCYQNENFATGESDEEGGQED